MKIIKNTSLQGISLVLTKPGGTETTYLLPKQKIEVPSSWGGKILETLVSRRMLKVREIADPVPAPKPAPVTKRTYTKKTKGE
jgi:hypothetical protein